MLMEKVICTFECNSKNTIFRFTGRIEAARMLLEAGAPAAVYNDEGISCLTLMVEKMPLVALDALDQFYSEDRALRKKFYYLNYLEKRLSKEDQEEIDLKNMRKSERVKRKKQLRDERKANKKTAEEKLRGELAKSPLEVEWIVLKVFPT